MKRVLLIPGFSASDLVDLDGDLRWFDISIAPALGIGCMRLDPSGVAPQPPDGLPLQVSTGAQDPWGTITSMLRGQLDPSQWSVLPASYDWRLNLTETARNFANTVRLNATPAEPMTLVGHSAGGLVAVLCWSVLNVTGQANLLRRVITIDSPFQGSYGPQQWIGGTDPTVVQLRQIAQIGGLPLQMAARWTLAFLNQLATTWPSFYQLMPSLLGDEALRDPHRNMLFSAANYDGDVGISQNWLNLVQTQFQPGFVDVSNYPPDWCLTAVIGTGISTAFALGNGNSPLELSALRFDQDGDGIVTVPSQTPPVGQRVTVSGAHASVPLGITVTGLLASLITDPRGPVSPPAPPIVVTQPIPANTTDPPESTFITGLQCVGGG